MKKILLLFFVFYFKSLTGQSLSYTATIEYEYMDCTASGYNCSNSLVTYSFNGVPDQTPGPSNRRIIITYNNIPATSFYTFSASGGSCLSNDGSNTRSFLPTMSPNRQPISGLITNTVRQSLLYGCFGALWFDGFIPNNMSIQNSNSTVCAGEQLSMMALPAGYPPEAYNWQYSIDNMATWVTVPKKMINGISTNNTTTSNFTMYDIFGADHVNHFGDIYFRIGYGSTYRYFTQPVKINYSPCTVVIKDRKYVAPDCSGDPVKSFVVYFDRDLEANETLSPFQIIPYPKQSGNPVSFSQNPVTSLVYDPETKWYKYSFIIPENEKLENRNYTIEYQSQVNGIPRGTLISDEPFLYIDPAKMQFIITGQTQPTCFGAEDGTIDIEILSGKMPYNFYVDNVLKTASKVDDLHYKITGLKANVLGYKIKVTDKNDCIEK